MNDEMSFFLGWGERGSRGEVKGVKFININIQQDLYIPKWVQGQDFFSIFLLGGEWEGGSHTLGVYIITYLDFLGMQEKKKERRERLWSGIDVDYLD